MRTSFKGKSHVDFKKLLKMACTLHRRPTFFLFSFLACWDIIRSDKKMLSQLDVAMQVIFKNICCIICHFFFFLHVFHCSLCFVLIIQINLQISTYILHRQTIKTTFCLCLAFMLNSAICVY